MKRLLLAFTILTALVTSALAQPRGYDTQTLYVVYTDAQTLNQNLASLNGFIDANIESELEYTVTAESSPFDFLFGYRMVRFRAFDENGAEIMLFTDYRVLDGLAPFWAQEIPVNVTAVYTSDFLGAAEDEMEIAAAMILSNQTTTGVVTLERAAPAGGLRVTLRSANPNALRVPASITIPAGQVTGTFTVTARRVTRNTNVRVTARIRGVNKTDMVLVRPG